MAQTSCLSSHDHDLAFTWPGHVFAMVSGAEPRTKREPRDPETNGLDDQAVAGPGQVIVMSHDAWATIP